MPSLDEALSRHRPGDATLVLNDPGVDARPFLVQAAEKALHAGLDVVLMTTDRAPRRFIGDLDVDDDQMARLHVLDAHSEVAGFADPDHTHVQSTNLLDAIGHIERAGDAHPGAVLVLESLNGLERAGGVQALAAQATRLRDALARYHDAIVGFTRWTEEVALASLLDGFAHRIHLQAVEDRVITSQYFRVERAAGESLSTAPVLYRSDDAHVRVYVPKIVVTGDADAGKTTFIHAVCDHAASTEQKGVTVAMDKGAIEREGLRVDIFGTPGQERFDPLLAPILRQAVGVILVVDSTRPETFERSQHMLKLAWRHGLHAVIAANKQDEEGALSSEEVESRIEPPAGVEVLPCQATDAASATGVFDALLSKILTPRAAA